MISENAEKDVQAKLEQFAQANGGTLKGLKCDDAYRQAYPDAVDLFEWRRQWMLAVTASVLSTIQIEGTYPIVNSNTGAVIR